MKAEALTAVFTGITAGVMVYDIYKNHKTISVSFVQVPNKNEGGAQEFRLESFKSSGTPVKEILILPNNRVQVEFSEGHKVFFSDFIYWSQ
jgi:hypothetical protein